MRISDWSSDVCASDLDEEEHVLALLVAEIFGDGEAGEGDAGAGARRLVHLAIDEGDLGAFGDRFTGLVLGDDAGIKELVIKIVALAGALADAGEHRGAAMALGDVEIGRAHV